VIRDQLLNKVQDAAIACLYDPRENSRWGLLRGLPALHYLGVDDFTYPTSWCQFGRGDRHHELPYDYHVVSNGLDIPDDNPDFGVVTNRYYEHETPYTIKYLINRYSTTDSMLFVLTDDRRFQPQDSLRPLFQEPFVDMLGTYASVYETFESSYEDVGWRFPLSDTKNVFVQDNAALYTVVSDESLADTTELFEVLPDAPYLPLYDALSDIFARPNEYGSVPLDGDEGVPELVRWLRRRIEWDRGTAREVANNLNDAVVADGSKFDPAAARRSPAVREAKTAAKDLEPANSAIDRRYVNWLTRYDL